MQNHRRGVSLVVVLLGVVAAVAGIALVIVVGGVLAITPATSVITRQSSSPEDALQPIESTQPIASARREMPVEDVMVEVGVGSPIPVDIVVSGTWPDLCAQLASLEQRREEMRIEITLLATPAVADCPPDHLGIPFRIAIPLNPVQLPVGQYLIIVNGVTTTFDWDPGQTAPAINTPTYATLPTCAASGRAPALMSKRVPSDRAGVDFIVSHDPAWGCSGYSAATFSAIPLTGTYALERGADKGLIQLVLENNRQVTEYVIPAEAIQAIVRVQYAAEPLDLTDVVFTADKLIMVHTLTANAGMFIISEVYELPTRAGEAAYAELIVSREQASILKLALDYYATMVKN
jgi:hypothetical protein